MGIKWEEQWVEILTFIFLVIGFILAAFFKNKLLLYSSIFLAGALAGRVFYIRRYGDPIFPMILVILGFIVGYMIGSFWANRFISLILFITGLSLSYYLHLKQILVSFKSENFVK